MASKDGFLSKRIAQTVFKTSGAQGKGEANDGPAALLEKLPTLDMDTDRLPALVRFLLFRLRVSQLADVSLRKADGERFRLQAQVWYYGDLLVATIVSFSGLDIGRTKEHIAKSGSDQCSVLLFNSGGARCDADGVAADASAGQIMIVDRSRPISFSAPRTSLTVLFIRRDRIAPLLPDGNLPHGLVVLGAAGALLADFPRSLERQSPAVTMDEAPHIERGACEIVAACISPSQERLYLANAQMEQGWRIEAKRVVDRELNNPDLSPEDVAKRLGLSRSKLYRLFEAEQGGVSAFIRRRRFRAACRLLADPTERRRISDISFACGFKSETHFSRAFRDQFGLTPSAHRERSGKTYTPPGEDDVPVPSDVVVNWLTGMD